MTRTYDLLGIGIGPFDLGLAALAEPLDDVDAVFLDQRDGFSWHAGMLIEGTTLQVPFLADLVTMADPTSAYSFLAWLKETGRLYQFYIRESFYPLRAEYDQYCRWVAAQLPTLRWGREVTSVVRVPDPAAEAGDPGESGYVFEVTAQTADGFEKYCAKHLVLGTGTRPRLPAALIGVAGRSSGEDGGPVVHTSDYLPNRDALRAAGSVTVVGSGQSAAEVYRDLLEDCGTGPGEHRVDWVTRSPRFFPMEYTKLTLEMTSPEYTDHYVALPIEQRDVLGREQRNLYKGISGDLIDDIYDTLYRRSALGAEVPTTLLSDTEVVAARFEPAGPDAAGAGEYVLTLRHAQLGTTVEHRTGAIVAATGYAATVPAFLAPGLVNLDARGRYAVARDYTVDDDRRIHVVGGEEHTHGVTAPDLGFGPWRNSVILANVTGREPYPVERRIAFQQFGLPGGTVPDEQPDHQTRDEMEAAR
ncbi:lysine N(6)-hydroxylase/L-ornithine N(5)-oxygenase family protein [Promicromonospora kroppenstedtii]|uniref:lysine N(6)-hydroxylase/L-ornithine N(5)-oxygenase family protein n=1 Tax=Promicromonospora kroppenstedtii TaxID=440482 RepID=UPI0004AEFCCA|nr:SidA/IucD/PvdA family monooxygenase [Promicromonospora kroppenstedtii]